MSKTSQEEGGDVRQDSSLRNKWLRLAINLTVLLALATAVSLMLVGIQAATTMEDVFSQRVAVWLQ